MEMYRNLHMHEGFIIEMCFSDRVMQVAKCAEIQHLDLIKMFTSVKRYFCKKKKTVELYLFIYN